MVRWQIPDRLHVVGSVTVYRSEYRSGRRARYIASAWDNRFVLNLSGTYELPKAWSIGAKLSAIGGAPYTPYDTEKSSLKEAWDARGRPYYDYSRYNEGRLPGFRPARPEDRQGVLLPPLHARNLRGPAERHGQQVATA